LPANETYHPRSSAGSSSGSDEKQCRIHGPVVPQQSLARVVVGGAGVDDDRLAGRARDRELSIEEELLRVRGRVVAEVVEPRLADRNDAGVHKQGAQLVQLVEVEGRRLVRVDAEDREDVVELLRELECAPGNRRASSRR